MSVNLSGWHEAVLPGQQPGTGADIVFSFFSRPERLENGGMELMSELSAVPGVPLGGHNIPAWIFFMPEALDLG